jgi:hypothetical protein
VGNGKWENLRGAYRLRISNFPLPLFTHRSLGEDGPTSLLSGKKQRIAKKELTIFPESSE